MRIVRNSNIIKISEILGQTKLSLTLHVGELYKYHYADGNEEKLPKKVAPNIDSLVVELKECPGNGPIISLMVDAVTSFHILVIFQPTGYI